jgi:hypothetical protein
MVSRQVERRFSPGLGYTDAMERAFLILAICALGPAAYLLARRVGTIVPLAFVAACVLAFGAVTFTRVVVFGMVDVKFRQMPVEAWLEVYWPLWTIEFVPSVVSALLACWVSRPSTRWDATVLLGVFLFLILVMIGAEWALDLHLGFWLFVALPSTVFFAMALIKQVAQGRRHRLSRP